MNKYHFTGDTATEIKDFAAELIQKGYSPNMVRQNGNYAGIFLEWIKDEGIEKTQVRYNEVIAFIRHLQEQEYNNRFINRVLLAVRHYYKYLGVEKNPASGIYLRGNKRLLPTGIVEYKEVQKLYADYPAKDNRSKRNRVILGLIIYQALSPEELRKLEPEHIKLREAKIHIPGSTHSNPRILELQAVQLLDMQEYLSEIRPQMLKEPGKERSGKKPTTIEQDTINRQLFFSESGSPYIKRSIYHLFKQVQQLNPKITSAKIIRQSVIAHWLKEKGIRQVQYMAGHRYVSSTQRYKDYNMEELAHALNSYHPLQDK
jgi:integrase/recombinase XerD